MTNVYFSPKAVIEPKCRLLVSAFGVNGIAKLLLRRLSLSLKKLLTVRDRIDLCRQPHKPAYFLERPRCHLKR